MQPRAGRRDEGGALRLLTNTAAAPNGTSARKSSKASSPKQIRQLGFDEEFPADVKIALQQFHGRDPHIRHTHRAVGIAVVNQIRERRAGALQGTLDPSEARSSNPTRFLHPHPRHYFHSQPLVLVFPAASTSYSNTTAMVFRLPSLAEDVLK